MLFLQSRTGGGGQRAGAVCCPRAGERQRVGRVMRRGGTRAEGGARRGLGGREARTREPRQQTWGAGGGEAWVGENANATCETHASFDQGYAGTVSQKCSTTCAAPRERRKHTQTRAERACQHNRVCLCLCGVRYQRGMCGPESESGVLFSVGLVCPCAMRVGAVDAERDDLKTRGLSCFPSLCARVERCARVGFARAADVRYTRARSFLLGQPRVRA